MIELKSLLLEGLSPILYYYRNLRGVYNMLKDNYILTSFAQLGDSDAEHQKGKFYYVSFSRIKWGGYNRGEFSDRMFGSITVFDGRKLSNTYKGVSVNYWSGWKSNDIETALKNDENEDRLITDSGKISNVKKYIKEVHIYVPVNNKDALYKDNIDMLFELPKLSNSIYFYDDPKAFKLLNKSKSKKLYDMNIDLSNVKSYDSATIDGIYDGYSFQSLVRIYNTKNYDSLSDADKKLVYTIKNFYHERDYKLEDLVTTIKYDIQNVKKLPPYRDDLFAFTKLMRKTKTNDYKSFLLFMQRKILKETLSDQEFKSRIRDVQTNWYKQHYPKEYEEFQNSWG